MCLFDTTYCLTTANKGEYNANGEYDANRKNRVNKSNMLKSQTRRKYVIPTRTLRDILIDPSNKNSPNMKTVTIPAV